MLAGLALAAASPAAAASRPANDAFAAAARIGASGKLAGTTAGATAEHGEPGAQGRATVWFAWKARLAGEAYVVVAGAGRPVSVRAYTGSAVGHLASADIADPGGQGVDAAIDALAGTTYRLQISSAAAHVGPFRLAIIQPGAGRPANDGFSEAASLTTAIADAVTAGASAPPVTGRTAGATGEHGEPGSPAHSVWYRWLAPAGAAGSLTVSLTDTTPRARLGLTVFTGTGLSRLTRVGSPGTERASFGVRAGVAYSIQVSGSPAYFRLAFRAAGLATMNASPPTFTCRRPGGWIDSNNAVACTASSRGSALAASADASFELTTSVAAGTSSASATTTSKEVCDKAGRCAVAGPYTGIEVDRVPPAVACSPAPRGWFRSVTVDCTASDPPGGSGLAVPAQRAFTLTATLPAGAVRKAVAFPQHAKICDRAGNCAAVPPPRDVSIDRSLPAVRCGAVPHGWVAAAPRIDCAASASGAGLAALTEGSFTLTSTVGQGVTDRKAFTSSIEVCDKTGNCRKVGPLGPIKVDREPLSALQGRTRLAARPRRNRDLPHARRRRLRPRRREQTAPSS